MLSPDTPICSKEEDVIGKTDFTVQLAQMLLNYDQKESLTIGLYGKWGTGKTSILNMVEDELKLKSDKSTAIVQFKPWLFTSQSQLVSQFFEQIVGELNLTKHKKLKKYLKRYSSTLNGVPNSSLRFVFHFIIDSFLNTKDIYELKKEIENELSRSDSKIIVFIDDIDRLTNEEIFLIFQLVKSIADFPNTIYLLAFDRQIVINALEQVQGDNGFSYLEKIINVPFELPMTNRYEMEYFLKFKIYSIVLGRSITYKDMAENMSGLHPDYRDINLHLDKKFHDSSHHIRYYLKNFRDVSRVSNAFALKYSVLKNKVNLEDLVLITIIQVFEPTVYDNLFAYEELFCGMPLEQITGHETTDLNSMRKLFGISS